MKANILRVSTVLFLVGGFLLCSTAFAQHEGLSPTDAQEASHLDYSPGDDKSPLTDHEAKAKITRDSISSHNRSATNVSKSKSQEAKGINGEDDDALSFNFLYYIIQKFKISDLIDE